VTHIAEMACWPEEPWPPEGVEEMPDRERDAAERIEYRHLLERYHPTMFTPEDADELGD
jgi:hypothetical protein